MFAAVATTRCLPAVAGRRVDVKHFRLDPPSRGYSESLRAGGVAGRAGRLHCLTNHHAGVVRLGHGRGGVEFGKGRDQRGVDNDHFRSEAD